MDIIQIKRLVEKNNIFIKNTFHVEEIGFFGSYVRGEEQTGSDLDILVEFGKGHKDFFNYMRLKYYLEEIVGLKIDLVIKDAVKPRLKQKIFEEVMYV